jgi:hypothetical protein
MALTKISWRLWGATSGILFLVSWFVPYLNYGSSSISAASTVRMLAHNEVNACSAGPALFAVARHFIFSFIGAVIAGWPLQAIIPMLHKRHQK